MINKQELIIKINNNLSKLKKDKLIEFYNIFINKKGGSALRSLCNHINNPETEKKFKLEKEKIKDDKLKYPQKYSTYASRYKELSKDTYAIYKFLTKIMFQEYTTYQTKNTELKFKFVCFTTYIKPIGLVGNPLVFISDFILNYFKEYSKEQKYSVNIVENSNKIRIVLNGIDFYIIYTKEFNRINIVMTLEPTSENKAKEYFDRFPECYKPSSVSYVPTTTTTTAFGTGFFQGVKIELTDAEISEITNNFSKLYIRLSEEKEEIERLRDKQDIYIILERILEYNRKILNINKPKITNYPDLLEKYKTLEKIFNELFINIINKLLEKINYEIRQEYDKNKNKYFEILNELNIIYDEKIRPIKSKYSIDNTETYNKFNNIDNNNRTYNLLIEHLLTYINELFNQYKNGMNKSEIDKLYAYYRLIKQELLNDDKRSKYNAFSQNYNKYLEESKKPIDIYTRGFEEVDILLLALIIYNYNQYITPTSNKITFDKYINIYQNTLNVEYNSQYTQLKNLFKEKIYEEADVENIGFFDKWFFKPIGTIQLFNPFDEYRKQYKVSKQQYYEQLNLISEYQKNYKILKEMIDNIVQILLKNNTFKQTIARKTDQEPLFTLEYVKQLNKIIIDMIYKDKYSYIRSELYAIKRLTEYVKMPKINKDAVITQPAPQPAFQPAQLVKPTSPPKPPAPAMQPAPAPQPAMQPAPQPAPAMQPAPIFDFNPEKLKAYRLATSMRKGGKKTKKTKKIRKTKK